MSAVDVGARGLAVRALAQSSAADEGVISLDARNSASAADTEALMDSAGAVSGRAGAVHQVEEIPYPKRVAIRGNGAELRNTNPTALSENLLPSVALALGYSSLYDTPLFAYFPVLAANGQELAVAAGVGASFAPGDFVVMHGSLKYTAGGYDVFRNYLRASVVDATGDTITLDRDVPAELLADDPVIANVTTEESAQGSYLLHRPHVSHFALSSEQGHPWFWGGVIDGTFRDICLDGRNAISFNAMQDCLFENIHFRAWRKICELAEGSAGTRVSGLVGTLSDASTKFGGGDDTSNSFILIGENCTHCVFEKLNVSSGPNNPGIDGNGALLGSGRNNVVRDSILRFPALEGTGLALISRSEPGIATIDCGFEDIDLLLPNGRYFFWTGDGGAGLVRPFFRNLKCHGSVSLHAGMVTGTDGIIENVWCESGSLRFGSATGWRIENCYFPGGFFNLTREHLHKNAIRNNESDASRRIAAAAIIETSQTTVTSTTPNQTFRSMTIAPGDLGLLDEVHFRLAGTTGGGGTNIRHVRVTCRIDGTSDVEIAHMTSSVNGISWAVEGTIEVQSNQVVHATSKAFSGSQATVKDTRIINGNLAANGLVLTVEIWTDSSGSLAKQLVKIAGQKAGMRNVSVFD